MGTFIKDIFGLMALNAREINYYGKYSVAISSLIFLFIGIAFHLATPVPATSAIAGFVFSIAANFLILIVAIFLVRLWLKIKAVSVSFSTLYSLTVLASVVDILIPAIDGLSIWLELPMLSVLGAVVFIYSLIVMVSALSKGANISIGFALSGLLLGTLLMLILTVLIMILGVAAGILLPPDNFAVGVVGP
jgi:hypothetical protein